MKKGVKITIFGALIAAFVACGIYFGAKTETFQKWDKSQVVAIDKDLSIASKLFLIAKKHEKAFSEIASCFQGNENFKAISRHATEEKEKMAGTKKALENLKKNNVLFRKAKELFYVGIVHDTNYKFTYTILSINNYILRMYVSSAYTSMLNLASDPKSSVSAVVTSTLNIQEAENIAAETRVLLDILEPQFEKNKKQNKKPVDTTGFFDWLDEIFLK